MSKYRLKVQTISVYISTTLVLLLLGIMGVLSVAASEVSRSIQGSLGVSVIFNGKTEESTILKFQKKLDAAPYVQSTGYISKEQALEEQKTELGIDPLEQLGYNPYDAEVEIVLKPEYANSDSLAMIETALLRNRNVKEVVYQKDLMNSVNDTIKKTGAVLSLFLIMLTLISWSLISNMVSVSIYSKRFMLHTMKLTGATWGFIRKPFIISNIWIGMFAGILADILLISTIYILQQQTPAIMSYLPIGHLAAVCATVILFGIVICSLCAYLSVNRFLRMRNNDLYFI